MFDTIVIGAGIAGTSAAAALAQSEQRVLLLEAEDHPGFHATGRSAALFAPNYGNATVRALTASSRPFFEAPPEGFTEAVLLRTRAIMTIARGDQIAALERQCAEAGDGAVWIDGETACRRVPLLRREYVAAALFDEHGGDLDVDALLQGYLRQFRKAGGQFVPSARASAIRKDGILWRVRTRDQEYTASVIINAAGAWADAVAEMAGLLPLGLTPLRRTALLVSAPKGEAIASWPMTVDADERFYFKPEAGALLLSPADETLSVPCDAQPEEIDIASAIDRVERAAALDVARVTHRWAGLRTFARDRSPVVGFDPRTTGFFWLAGQGGYGVQTAPALADFVAAVVARRGGHNTLASQLEATLSPTRLAGTENLRDAPSLRPDRETR